MVDTGIAQELEASPTGKTWPKPEGAKQYPHLQDLSLEPR